MQEEEPSVLRVPELSARDSRVPEVSLFRGEIEIQPSTTDSSIAPDALNQKLGKGFTALRRAFRIAPGQRVTIPATTNGPIDSLALICALPSAEHVRQGEEVLRVELSDASHSGVSAAIRAGEDTASADHDALRPGVDPLKRAEIFCSYPYPGHSWKEQGMQAYAYLARVPVSHPNPALVIVKNTGPV